MTEGKALIALWDTDRALIASALISYADELRRTAKRRAVAGPEYKLLRRQLRASATSCLRLADSIGGKHVLGGNGEDHGKEADHI